MSESRPYTMFREAVLDLAEEPTPVNVRRYLAASRMLDPPATTGTRDRSIANGRASKDNLSSGVFPKS